MSVTRSQKAQMAEITGAERSPAEAASGPVRRMLLALVIFGGFGLLAELFLLEHTESVWQWLPITALVMGLASGGMTWLRPTRRSVRAFQTVMLICVLLGGLGVYLHFDGNIEFEREMDESLQGLVLFWRALRGATPALAPGALAQLGLLGLIQTYRHPALESRDDRARSRE